MKVTAIIPAAGAGKRFSMKKGQKKPFFILKNKPILIYTLEALENSLLIDDIVVVVHKNDIEKWQKAIKKHKLKKIRAVIAGAETRSGSVKKGLNFLKPGKRKDIVFIHDGVRPFISKKIISDTIRAALKFGAAVFGMPVTSTIKFVSSRLDVENTPKRSRLYTIQTPQAFKRDIILKAYQIQPRRLDLVTDDSMLVERMGCRVKVVKGSYRNIKITTPEDIALARKLLEGVGFENRHRL